MDDDEAREREILAAFNNYYRGNYVAEKLALLRRNDPSETSVDIRLCYFDDNELSLSEALHTNEHVKWITFCLENTITLWDSLLSILKTHETLEKVTLNDSYGLIEVTPFLLAIQQNPRIQTVELCDLQFSGDHSMAWFLDSATAVTTLGIYRCGMLQATREGGASSAIAAALQRNTNIQRLKLDEVLMDMIPIVTSLASNTSVKELCLGFPSIWLNELLALQNLLESTTTIERFELDLRLVHGEADSFRPIAQGLIQSVTVTDVSLVRCRFDSQEEVLVLNSILETKSNLKSLVFKSCRVHQDGQKEFQFAIYSLLQPHSLLRSLEFDYEDYLASYGFHTAQNFARLLIAVESSPLECFFLGKIGPRDSCVALIASIPKMQVGTLQFELGDLQDLKGDVIQAIKRNASIRTFVAKVDEYDDDDRRKLTAYSVRNEFLAQWTENPNLVPDAAWPEYLAVAQTTGPDAVFSILVSLAPSAWPFDGE
jgi:hypothetical protein